MKKLITVTWSVSTELETEARNLQTLTSDEETRLVNEVLIGTLIKSGLLNEGKVTDIQEID